MNDRVAHVETYVVTVPRDVPYLGPLASGERINARGYVVRKGNGTIYPTVDRSVVVRVTSDAGFVGWGETYGICAPRATCEIINDLFAPVLIGAEIDPERAWDELYGLMRVRGCSSGPHADAIAALDIALWDLRGQAEGKPIRDLIGPTLNSSIPGYVSGLPAATLRERVTLARSLQAHGHNAIKFAAAVSHEGIAAEMAALRRELGDEADILVDLHWKFEPDEALRLIGEIAPYDPGFVESPVKPEDMAGLAHVARRSPVPVAAGEEWYTEFEVANRLALGPVAFLQPEMAHTGITQFVRIARLAAEHGTKIAPHATVGTGLFLAASLQLSATLPHLWKHEWQHSIFARNLVAIDSAMAYVDGAYRLPCGSGLGARPNDEFWRLAELVT